MMREPRPGARSYAVLAAGILTLAIAVRADVLTAGFSVDDYAQLAMMRGEYPVSRGPLELFTFSNGSAAENRALRDSGFFPWWSHPQLRISMCRPLSSALMWLDLKLFGLNATGYQLHGLAWWIALFTLFALLLRRLLPPSAALLALAVFALDESHGTLLGWIAMRNAVVASSLALLALLLRLRALEHGQADKVWPALVAFALALLASEYAIAFAGYLLVLELSRAGRGRRLAALAPWAALLAAYFGLRAAFGFGAYGSGMYVDPIAESAEFLRAAAVRLPVLAGDVALGVRSNFWTAGFPWAGQLAAAGVIPPGWAHDMQPLRAVQQHVGLFALALLALVVVAAARTAVGRNARFLLLGVPLALVPVLPALPEGRLLLPAIAGFATALACCVHACAARLRRGPGRLPAALGLALVAPLLALQLTTSVYFSWLEGALNAPFANVVRRSILAPQLDAALRPGMRVLLLGAADPTTTIYIPLMRRVHGRPVPDAVHLLTGTFVPHRMLRVAPNAFVLERMHAGYTPGDAYASAFNSRPLRAGERFAAGGLRVTVERVHQGRPLRARFELDVVLEDPGVVLLAQTLRGLQRLAFPPLGRQAPMPAPMPPFELIAR